MKWPIYQRVENYLKTKFLDFQSTFNHNGFNISSTGTRHGT